MYEKPLMRGLFIRQAKKMLLQGAGLSILSGALFIEFYMKPRQRLLFDYYNDFDPRVSFNYMCSQGWMKSCPKTDD